MNRFAWALCLLPLLLVPAGCHRTAPPPSPPMPPMPTDWRPAVNPKAPPSKELAEANNRFAFDLYRQLAAKTDDPIFFSPFSISTALAMTYAGAKGETAEQMARTLHFTLPPEKLHPAIAAQLWQLSDAAANQGYEIGIANRLWAQQDHKYLDEFLKTERDDYGIEPAQADFTNHPDAARGEINAWVAKETNQVIKEMIRPGVFNADTRLVLTNAIYFKANWRWQFDESLTSEKPFHRSNGQSTTVQMMFQTAEFKCAWLDDAALVEMNYKGDDISMIVILPKKLDGLSELEKTISAEAIDRSLANSYSVEVGVSLPKFKLERELSLAEALSAMGMPAAFSRKQADLSGINGQNDLYLADVLHKAIVDVDEQGTEAAAATVVRTDVKSARGPDFIADHPFLFLIRDTHSGSILFMGRFTGPAN